MKNYLLLISAFWFARMTLIGQSVLVPNATAGYHSTSPESLAEQKQSSVPVNLSTGMAQIGIPLANLAGKSTSVSYSLNYDASGRKVDEQASYTGWGWNLSGGGQITRVVKGKQDEYDACIEHAYQNQDGYSQLISWTWKSNIPASETKRAYITSTPSYNSTVKEDDLFAAEINAYQPDEYHFSFNGRSGMFVIDQNGQPTLLPYQNLKIEFQECLHWFKITDERGYVYQFGLPALSEFGLNPFSANAKAATTWYLLTIKNPYGETEFTFNYGPDQIDQSSNSVNIRTEFIGSLDCPATSIQNSVYYTNYHYRRISSVVSCSGSKLEFYTINDRLDKAGQKSLDEVWLYNNDGLLIHKYLLEYGYFLNQFGGNERLKLNSIKVRNILNEVQDVNSFNYDESLPVFDNELVAGRDHWGYYNGLNFNAVQEIYFNGGRRRVNPVYNQIGILKRITSATGAITEFNYETNTYSESPKGLVLNEPILGPQLIECSEDIDLTHIINYKNAAFGSWTYGGPIGGFFPDQNIYPEPNCATGYTFHNPNFSYIVGPEVGSDGIFSINDEDDIDHPNNSNNTDPLDLEISYLAIPKIKTSKRLFTIDVAQHITITGVIAKSICNGVLSSIKIVNHSFPNNVIWSQNGIVELNINVNHTFTISPGTYELICATAFPYFEEVEINYIPNNFAINVLSTHASFTFTPLEIPIPAEGVRYCGGLRVSSILVDNGDGDLTDAILTKLDYNFHSQPGISSGYLYSDPIYEFSSNDYYDQYKRTGGGCGGGLQLCHECDLKKHISSGINALIAANGAFQVYRNVTIRQCNSNGSCENGWTEEVFSCKPSTNANPVIQESNPYQSWETGLSLESRTFNQNAELISTTWNTYSNLFTSPRIVNGIRVGVSNIESIAPNESLCEVNNHSCSYLMDYLVTTYSYLSNSIVLVESITRSYDQWDQSKWMKSTNTSYYESVIKGAPSKIITESLDPQKPYTVKKAKYVGDYNVTETTDEMSYSLNYLQNIGRFGLNAPVETITLQGSSLSDLKVIDGQLNTFKMVGTRVVADASYHLELLEPLPESEFEFSSIVAGDFSMSSYYIRISNIVAYDNEYRPITTRKENDILNTVIRDYQDGRVVAEITNADADRCAYTSFETTNGGGWTYINQWTASPSFSHLGFNLKKAKTGLRVFGFQGTAITKEAKPGNYIISMWSTSPAFSLSLNGQIQARVIEQDGEDAMGWAYYEYLVDCTQNYDIQISGSNGVLLDELRMYPVDAAMKTVAYNPDGTVRTQCGVNNRCTTYLYDTWKRTEWTLDDNWEILTYNEYHIKDQNDPNDHSWYKQKVVLDQGLNKVNVINATAYSNVVSTSISYSDALGRPLQNIAVRQSPAGYDMVSFHEYDELGRESKKYAPFTRPANNGSFITDIITKQKNFYQNASKVAHTNYPFAENVFEASPLNRVLESGNLGQDWQIGSNHTLQSYTLLNDEADQILLWRNDPVEHTACAMDLMNGGAVFYPSNSLIKQYVVNEHGDEAWEFTNALGQLICKRIKVWASQEGTEVYTWTNDDGTNNYPYSAHPTPEWRFYDTYFVYDDFGRIEYEVPAIAIQKMNNVFCFTNRLDELNYDILDGYMTVYAYDRRGRQILKKKPGEQLSQYVYNTLNQIVLSRSAELPSGQWNFIKYDVMGRPVQTGLFTTALTREDMQLICDNANSHLWELKSGNVASPYLGNSFPGLSSNDIVLTETYYDDYKFQTGVFSYNFWNTNQGVEQLTQGKRTRGATTGMKVRILNSTDPYPYLLTVNYFDKNGRSNLIFKEHLFGGFDRFLTEYDYTGKVSQTLRTHKKTLSPADEPVFILNQYTYDHAGRPLETKQKIDDAEIVTLSKLNYNELGQVIKKQLHITPETTIGMQTIDYRYNERGWLTKINNADLVNDGDNLESWDVFGEELIYQENDRYYSNYFQAIPQYNGRVSAIKWKTKLSSDEDGSTLGGHSYVYRYDQLGQMLGAYYAASSDTYIDNYSEYRNNWDERLSYDANGNIRTLRRHRGKDSSGENVNNPIMIDNLTYTYQHATNKLINIDDTGEVSWQAGFTHFIDVLGEQNDYHYDEEARLKGDLNKNIEFQYNHLDLVEWAGNTDYGVDFMWDATGSKLRSVSPQSVSTYIGGIEYSDDHITHIATTEGIVRKNHQGTWTYDYYLKDHLGNIRAILATEASEIITEKATMELTVRVLEESGFENIATTEYDKPYLYPYDPSDPDNAVVSKLNAQQGKVIGPSKVMAVKRAELLDISTQYWYQEEPGETVITDLSQIMAGVLLNLTGAGIGVIPSGPEQGLALINNVSGSQYQALESFITNSFNGIDLETTGAHLVYMFFNTRMALDPALSGTIPVTEANTLGQITRSQMGMPGDGFFYVYVTNLSASNVYFNNLTIKRWKPQVRVSYDYYPYGLTWQNPDLQDEESKLHDHAYQDKEFMFGEYDGTVGLALYDFHARMYDPALCRWLVPDPAAQFANPYLAMGNNPVVGVDPDGKFVNEFFDLLEYVSPIVIRPVYETGTDKKGWGWEISIGVPKAIPFSYRWEYGETYYKKGYGEKSGTQIKKGGEVTYFGIYSTGGYRYYGDYAEGEFTQTTSTVTIGIPFLNVKYENDIMPWTDGPSVFQKVLTNAGLGLVPTPDQGDRFRTAGMKVQIGILSVGFELFTGDPGFKRESRFSDKYKDSPNGAYYVNENGNDPNKYREGIAYVGFGPFRFGRNNEANRHGIQNKMAHDAIGVPWFQILEIPNNPYFYFGTGPASGVY